MRILLLVVGVALLLWIPVSFFTVPTVWIPIPGSDSGSLSFELGNARVMWVYGTPKVFSLNGFDFWWRSPGEDFRPLAEFDWFRNDIMVEVILPLWLPAILCLAWPVTSFFLARRKRHSRGFEVQAKADSAVSTADS